MSTINSAKVSVALAQLSEETRCPICLGILRHTVVSAVCLHRFCAPCINTCLSGRPPDHKDCPVCRTNMHSHRSLRPDPNFDQLLEALYGNVVEYSRQEDALVAARNAARAAQVAEQQQLRRVAREAQAAAATAARSGAQPPRTTSHSCVGTGIDGPLASQPTAPHPNVTVSAAKPQPLLSRDSDTVNAAARSGGARRPRNSHSAGGPAADTGGEGASDMPHESEDVSRGAKRQRQAAPHPQAAALTALLPLHPQPSLVPTAALNPSESLKVKDPQNGSGSHSTEIALSTSPPHPPCATDRVDREVDQGGDQSPPLGSQVPVSDCAVHSEAVGRRVAHTAAAAAGGGGANGTGGGRGGLLAVPTARSAAELSFRHAGMLVVQLLPGSDTRQLDGGGREEGTDVHAVERGGNGAGNIDIIGAKAPALEKPFLLCPVGWTVGHIAQLLSQWLPTGQTAPGSLPALDQPRAGPLSDITLAPAPGLQPGGRSRHLRKCMGLGSLAAELLLGAGGKESRRLGAAGVAAVAGSGDGSCSTAAGHLVLVYSLSTC